MGYGIRPYAVSLARLRRACGSSDEALIARTLRELGDDVREHDAWFADEIAAGAPPIALALRRLVEGTARRRRHGFQYVHALELLCRQLGRPMIGPPLERASSDFLDAVDLALARRGVAIRTAALIDGEPPVPLPRASSPSVATLDRPAVRRALSELSRVDASAEEPGVADAIEQLTEWMRIACAERGAGVVSFFS